MQMNKLKSTVAEDKTGKKKNAQSREFYAQTENCGGHGSGSGGGEFVP